MRSRNRSRRQAAGDSRQKELYLRVGIGDWRYQIPDSGFQISDFRSQIETLKIKLEK
jgi:hypothetical protein